MIRGCSRIRIVPRTTSSVFSSVKGTKGQYFEAVNACHALTLVTFSAETAFSPAGNPVHVQPVKHVSPLSRVLSHYAGALELEQMAFLFNHSSTNRRQNFQCRCRE
ncbi:hypothetical protein PAXRUDRAFT_609509 [Paxillus rubicundulus Ve08.2h10]|uniref:Uncharacterized protein n=1 Tax=Paxillus rubicundulus Ve08.2h10 TaxID=930991 RepID=A0A0D0E901_9AGAM|nr:hypothetical protein PAXRUDRAFT_609509 [Paxillus rubicundulus Ve08.2h10]